MKHTIARYAFAAASVVMAGAFVAGCGGNNNPPYPTTPTDSRPMTPPPTVPVGAELLSSGPYNQITFKVPPHAGLLYIVDTTSNQVVGTTNAVESDAGKGMTMADLRNTTQGLDTSHSYQIYYSHPQTTTKPVGGMTMPM